jgi:hypothetical protein
MSTLLNRLKGKTLHADGHEITVIQFLMLLPQNALLNFMRSDFERALAQGILKVEQVEGKEYIRRGDDEAAD